MMPAVGARGMLSEKGEEPPPAAADGLACSQFLSRRLNSRGCSSSAPETAEPILLAYASPNCRLEPISPARTAAAGINIYTSRSYRPWFPFTPLRPCSMAYSGNHHPSRGAWFPHNLHWRPSMASAGNHTPPRGTWFPLIPHRRPSVAHPGNHTPFRVAWFPYYLH